VISILAKYSIEEHKMANWNERIIKEFRENEGRVGGPFAGGRLLLLHTTGAKNGEERVNPLATFEDGDRLVIIASKGGAPTNPDWFYNLVANPIVGVEYGVEEFQAKATVTSEPERSELYSKMTKIFKGFADYEKKTTRVIPVITLERLY
jgi:deazaflavin-dependent oxidoreductase (nitroreductase family)